MTDLATQLRPQQQERLQWFRINDFKPGIADNPGIQYPVGQAQRTNTYRCMAHKSGALVPAPRSDYSLNGTLFEGTNPSLSSGYFCAGIYVAGPELPTAGAASTRPHELWIATEYGKTGPSKERRLQRIRLFESAPTTDLIVTQTNAAATDTASAWGATFAQTRSNSAAPTTPGIPVVLIAWGSNVATFTVAWSFPNDTTPTNNTPFTIGAAASAIAFINSHQGRAICRVQTTYGHGTNGSWATTEDIKFTNSNNVQSALSATQTFFPENTDGYSCIASMSANELFMLKESGAVLVAGDLVNPLVRNLPMVPGNATGATSQGVRTQLGFVYPGRNNLWVWTGGDSAEAIFDNMQAKFWVPPLASSFLANSALWYAAENLVFLSNNFFFDTDTQSLWQIEDPATAQFAYASGSREFVYFAVGRYTHVAPQVVWGYNLTLGATSYSWLSHPLWVTVDRKIKVREVELRATGTGTVKVTATAQDGTTDNHTFTFGSSTPSMQRSNLAVTGDNITFRIESTGTGGNEAPTVWELNGGWEPLTRKGVAT